MNLNYLEETIRTSKYLVCLAGMEGIMLEKVLHNLDMPIQVSSYELVE